MEPKFLMSEFGDSLVFAGGVDTQQLLPFGEPEKVKLQVKLLRSIYAPYYIVSPSHEALLPNVPVKNVEAMSVAACNS